MLFNKIEESLVVQNGLNNSFLSYEVRNVVESSNKILSLTLKVN